MATLLFHAQCTNFSYRTSPLISPSCPTTNEFSVKTYTCNGIANRLATGDICSFSASTSGTGGVTGDGCAALGLYILSHGASFASMIPRVPQLRWFGGDAGGAGVTAAAGASPSGRPVASGLGMENVAVFILREKAAACLRQSAGMTHDAQE